jgi:hypothetical protein
VEAAFAARAAATTPDKTTAEATRAAAEAVGTRVRELAAALEGRRRNQNPAGTGVDG